MSVNENPRTILAVSVSGPASVDLSWSDGTNVVLDLGALFLADKAFASLCDPAVFGTVAIGDWGHSLTWPVGIELGADTLWLETLSVIGHADARAFLEWRLRHGLSLSKAADALGVSRRMIAYYSSGDRRVPKPILLACRGWEVGPALDRAA